MILQKLKDKNLISPPKWILDNCHYLVITGSLAYGTSLDSSDEDIVGWCIPPKRICFPHTVGIIPGFGYQGEKFDQYLQHHIKDEIKEYDITIFNIIKYFNLLMEGNPNIIDTIFVPFECIKHSTQIGNMVRENRKIFLHKESFKKYKGYCFSQIHKMNSKEPLEGSKRAEIREKYQFDVKYAMHLARLVGYIEQILLYGDLDLRKDKEHLKAIRRGEVSKEDILKWFYEKEIYLEKLYLESKLQLKPNESEIKHLLINCLEQHYGSIENCITKNDCSLIALNEIKKVLEKYNI